MAVSVKKSFEALQYDSAFALRAASGGYKDLYKKRWNSPSA